MRALLQALGLLGALVLWGVWQLSGGGLPWEVTIRPALRAPAAPGPERLLRAEVTATYPHLEGLALGDAVQFDRYGVVAPTAGSVRCTPLQRGGRPVQVTPIGGRITHAGSLALTLVPPGTAGCSDPASSAPLVSVHP